MYCQKKTEKESGNVFETKLQNRSKKERSVPPRPLPATPLSQGLHIKLTGTFPFTPVNIKKVVTMKIL